MKSLYRRLDAVGYAPSFVRERLLPDWWDDALALNPATLAMAHVGLSRMLGIEIGLLRDESAELKLSKPKSVRLKRNAGGTESGVRPAVNIAHQAAALVISVLEGVPAFGGAASAAQVRAELLQRLPIVNLDALLDFAWRHGIAVLHLRALPERRPRFAGLAACIGKRPVVVLASRRDAPAWLAFHLAHELGHVLLGHVVADGDAIADADLDAPSRDAQEVAADRFAMALLTGGEATRPQTFAAFDARTLAAVAKYQGSEATIDPGTLCLMHGRTHKRFPAAQAALRTLGIDGGGTATIARHLMPHVAADRPETAEMALGLMTVA